MDKPIRSTIRSHRILNIGHGVIDPSANHTDQLSTNVDRLRTGTLIVLAIPLLSAAFHLRCVVGRQGQTLEAATRSNGTGRNEVVQRQRIEGPETTPRTLDGLINCFNLPVLSVRGT